MWSVLMAHMLLRRIDIVELAVHQGGSCADQIFYDLKDGFGYLFYLSLRELLKPTVIECLMNYGMRFITLYRRQGSRPSPGEKKCKKANGCLGRPYK